MADKPPTGTGTSSAANAALVQALNQARLHIDVALKGFASGQPTLKTLQLSSRLRAEDTNSGCNTGCGGGGGGGGSGCEAGGGGSGCGGGGGGGSGCGHEQ
jgi:hypothetical protein